MLDGEHIFCSVTQKDNPQEIATFTLECACYKKCRCMRDHPIQVLDQYVMVLPGPNRDCHCSVLPQESINISNSDHPHVCIQSLKGGRTTVQCELLFTGDTMDELGGGGVTFSRAGMEMGRPCRARGTRLLEVKGLDPSQGHKKEGNKADCT